MNRFHTIFGAVFIATAMTACAPVEEVANEESGIDEITAMPSGLYFARLRHDDRRCVSPICGGNWVRRLNRTNTVCVNGSTAAECYVAQVDWSGSGLNDAEVSDLTGHEYVVRGKIVPRSFASFGTLGVFVVSEAWRGASDAPPTGTFTNNRYNGITCVRAPCPSLTSARLNSLVSNNISDIDFTRVTGVEPALIRGAGEQLRSNGVIVAGTVRTDRTGGQTLTATQFYLRAAEGVRAEQFCTEDSECTRTAYNREVLNTSQCYCALCPSNVVNQTTATLYATSYNRFRCATVARPCPLPPCASPPPVACVNHACSNSFGTR
jgi:hypothetical protein